MRNEADKTYYIYNDVVCNNNNDEGFKIIKGESIYEVIRIANGKPLFLEEHINRFKKSAQLLNYTLKHDENYFFELINKLVDINKCKNINVKLIASGFKKEKEDILGCFIKSYYPDEKTYREGIKTILIDVERENPNVKSINTNFKKNIKVKLEENQAFEALIVNDEGFITEGSRSNMFFVKNDLLYTSPAGDVLLGVTRNHIIKACEDLHIKIVQENIHVNDLEKIDGAFMTGTSVGVLPITYINDLSYNSVAIDLIKKISEKYNDDVRNYLCRN
ncbi:aminotransferase class IV [Abyssisolibacter fermentans]|uniref:aminotransferase class IV n=1 Tax=Abyssisolibacter fermentans TaxID=1766203 RepID=UPI00083070A8|nr:aminotransferase class IV [Abyssisolibacter fermentans]